MNRQVTLIAAIVMSVSSFALYQTELGVRRQEKQLAALERQIDEHNRAVRVLRAEWAHLSEPRRLQDLAFRYLQLAPMAGAQIAAVNDLPLRSAEVAEAGAGPKWPGSQDTLPLPAHRPAKGGALVMTSQGVRR